MINKIILALSIFSCTPILVCMEPVEVTSAIEFQAGLESLPPDLQREILRINAAAGPGLNINALAKGILAMGGSSSTLRAAINNPQNILMILKAVANAYTAGALYLAKKLQAMPSISNPEVMNWIIAAGKRLETGKELYKAVRESNVEIVQEFLKNPNLALNWKGKNDWTPVALAAFKGDSEIVAMLLKAGASPNIKNTNGETALSQAAFRGFTEIVRLLLDYGANPDLKDNSGLTARDRADQSQHTQVVKLLDEASAARKGHLIRS